MKSFYLNNLLILFVVFLFLQGAPKLFAQTVQLIDSRTGKPVEKDNLPRFFSTGVADGIINKTNIKFSSSVFFTNDENSITKTIFYSKSEPETRKYFEKQILVGNEIIERKNIKVDNKKTIERYIALSKGEDGNRYNIFLYDGGKSFVGITAEKLELALEFENWIASKK